MNRGREQTRTVAWATLLRRSGSAVEELTEARIQERSGPEETQGDAEAGTVAPFLTVPTRQITGRARLHLPWLLGVTLSGVLRSGSTSTPVTLCARRGRGW